MPAWAVRGHIPSSHTCIVTTPHIISCRCIGTPPPPPQHSHSPVCVYQVNLTACMQCEAGTRSPSPDSTHCETCISGHIAPIAGLSLCFACEPGRVEGGHRTACEQCAAGQVARAAGLSSCSACEPGRVSRQDGASVCLQCEKGTYQHSSHTLCPKCPLGQVSSMAGATVCLDCPPAQYANSEGSSQCTACRGDEYSSLGRATACGSCPAGSKVNYMAAPEGSAIADCVCPANQYMHCDHPAPAWSLCQHNASVLCEAHCKCTQCPSGADCSTGNEPTPKAGGWKARSHAALAC